METKKCECWAKDVLTNTDANGYCIHGNIADKLLASPQEEGMEEFVLDLSNWEEKFDLLNLEHNGKWRIERAVAKNFIRNLLAFDRSRIQEEIEKLGKDWSWDSVTEVEYESDAHAYTSGFNEGLEAASKVVEN